MCKKLLFNILSIICILCITVALFTLVKYDISSIAYFNPTEKSATARIPDFYQMVANKRDIAKLDSTIVIVNIDNCNRDEIAETIELLGLCETKAIGVDIFFDSPTSNDQNLIQAIESCENIVLPVYMCYDTEQDIFTKGNGSFFYKNFPENKYYGAINLVGDNMHSIIREFRREFPCINDTIPNFVARLTELSSSISYKRLNARNNKYETIWFPSKEFSIIKPIDILEKCNYLQGKIVLLGTVSDYSDFHITPIDYQMPGVILHAYALSTILNDEYVYQCSEFIVWIISILLCAIIVVINIILRQNNLGNLIVRILQMVILYLIVLIGCNLFVYKHICIDFAKPLLLVGLGLVATDIWYGIIYLILRYKCTLNNKRK